MNNIVLLGMQGAGKGTQAKLMIKKFGEKFNYFESGDIIRALSSSHNALGIYLQETMNKGELIKDGFVSILLDAFFFILKEDQYILLDGYPRTMYQMFLLLDKFERVKRDFKVIYLDLDEGEAIRRLSSRRICKDCGAVFSMILDGNISHCNKCSGELFQRKDDTTEAIAKRISIFKASTLPIIEYFDVLGYLTTIDAAVGKEKVYEEILKVLD